MDIYTTGQVAKILNIKRWKMYHLLCAEKIAEPHRLNGNRVFTKKDIAEIKRVIQNEQCKLEKGDDKDE